MAKNTPEANTAETESSTAKPERITETAQAAGRLATQYSGRGTVPEGSRNNIPVTGA